MNDSKTQQKIPLILASNGKTGSRVAERFRASGLGFREGSRQSEIPFDWYDASTWQKALDGISAVYVVFYPDLAVPGSKEIIAEFTRTAEASGVEHLVMLTGRGEEEAQACEKIVMNSALDWTIVRASWFAQNFSENFFLDDILRGQVVVPFEDFNEPFVDADDIADVAFAALTDKKHRGQVYEVTDPDLLSFRETIREIGEVSNRDIAYQQVPMVQYEKLLAEAEVPKDFVWLLKYLFTEVLDGRNAYLADGVKQALGREPRSFHAYAAATAETGVWN